MWHMWRSRETYTEEFWGETCRKGAVSTEAFFYALVVFLKKWA
jgi:hypothetical protein